MKDALRPAAWIIIAGRKKLQSGKWKLEIEAIRRMKRTKILWMIVTGLAFAAVGVLTLSIPGAAAKDPAQVPTGSVPTVTGTPAGAMVQVKNTGEQDQLTLRAGPGAIDYEIVGVLIVGQTAPALGRSVGGDWIQIAYPGAPGGVAWVYSPLVDLTGAVSIVEPPPTPTPRVTPTIDPTLAAQFLVEAPPTRLPTFTAPPPLSLPTFTPQDSAAQSDRVPMGLVIVALGVVGMFGALISFLRGS